eukprot:TRINITY_DN7396_c0_g4_i2.p1 TRINITY_DN7396_c0_g4~~TRINITY_DN7396_c0_g4_i2.p1  ORF type:complete len:299 (-),score=33.79 TRINITY_DN7396_c0_g4_i2:225-1121(-)
MAGNCGWCWICRHGVILGAADSDPGGASAAGSAYIFARSGTSWSQQAYLTASDRAAGSWFGWSVSITDSYAAVGARWADPDGVTDAGAAYVFVRSGTTWTQQAYLKASVKAASDDFGFSISMTNDRVLVGGMAVDHGSVANAGAGYVFLRTDTTWTQQAMLTASNKVANDYLGGTASMTDTYALLGIASVSRSYIFSRSGTTWSEMQILPVSAPERGVAISSSVAVVRTSVYTLSGSTWVLQQTLGRSPGTYGSIGLSKYYLLISNHDASPGGLANAGESYVFLNPSKSITSWPVAKN